MSNDFAAMAGLCGLFVVAVVALLCYAAVILFGMWILWQVIADA